MGTKTRELVTRCTHYSDLSFQHFHAMFSIHLEHGCQSCWHIEETFSAQASHGAARVLMQIITPKFKHKNITSKGTSGNLETILAMLKSWTI